MADATARATTDPTAPGAVPPLPVRAWLLILPLSTGAAVLAYLLAEVSLRGTAAALAAVGVVASLRVRRGLSPAQRRAVAERIRVGLIAGVVAVVAYDVVRYGLSVIGHLSLGPFRPFALFGQQFIGADASVAAQYAVGTVYHVLNGLGFAVAYTLFVRQPRVWSAVLWAGALELFTIVLYPSWLKLQAIGEFTQLSMIGHAAYGLGLGYTARLLTEGQPAERSR